MTSFEADRVQQWTRQIQDAIAGDSALREGLSDDDALPLVNWGADQAETVAQRLAAAAPAPDAEQVANTAYTLGRLMTRINWVVTYRAKKDAAWLARTFAKINALSREVFGPDAPTLSDEEIATWIADQPGRTNGELVRGLLARLTPAESAGARGAGADAPAPAPPQIPMPPRQDDPSPPDRRAAVTGDDTGPSPREWLAARTLLRRLALARPARPASDPTKRPGAPNGHTPPADPAGEPPHTEENEGL